MIHLEGTCRHKSPARQSRDTSLGSNIFSNRFPCKNLPFLLLLSQLIMAASALTALRPVTKVRASPRALFGCLPLGHHSLDSLPWGPHVVQVVQGQKMKEGAGVTICRTVR